MKYSPIALRLEAALRWSTVLGFLATAALGQTPNDACGAALHVVGPGPHPFDTLAATTGAEGQSEPACATAGPATIANDVWFTWTAPVTRTVSVSTCGLTALDTRVAVYAGSGCPAAPALACNDDACASESRTTFSSVAGSTYTIQIGNHPGLPGGIGAFTIDACEPEIDPCQYDDAESDMVVGSGVPGGVAWLQRFGVPGGARDVAFVAAAWGSRSYPGLGPASGSTVTVAVLEDPNDDGDPTDAVLLESKDFVVRDLDRDHLMVCRFDAPVATSGVFFVAASMNATPGQSPAPLDVDACIGSDVAWITWNLGVPVQLANLASNSTPPQPVSLLGFHGAWLLRIDCEEEIDPCSATLEFEDQEFVPVDWTAVALGGATVASTSQLTGGPGGTFRSVRFGGPLGASVADLFTVDNLNAYQFGYFPVSASLSVDIRASSTNVEVGLALRQGGQHFVAALQPVATTAWTHYAWSELDATAFTNVAGGPGADFSCTNVTTEVGWFVRKTNGAGGPITVDVDGFEFTFVVQPCAMPSCCDDGEAPLDSMGEVILPSGLDPAGLPVYEEVEVNRGNVASLYPSLASYDQTWLANYPCEKAIGGELTPETADQTAMTAGVEGDLAALDPSLVGITAQHVFDALNQHEPAVLSYAIDPLNWLSRLPSSPPLQGGTPYPTPPPVVRQPDPSLCHAFSGRDIVFVHDIQLTHLLDAQTGSCNAQQQWQSPTSFPSGVTQNQEYYTDSSGVPGYFKETAENYWKPHIEQFLQHKNYKNRYLVVAFNSNQRLDVAAQAVLTQISDAMKYGTGVVDLSGHGDRTVFGTKDFVVVSAGMGSLVTDVAMQACIDHPNLGVPFIQQMCKAHVALHGGFYGTRYATAAIVASGALAITLEGWECPLSLIAFNAFLLATGNCTTQTFSCPFLVTALASSMVIDCVPIVAEHLWEPYAEQGPVRTLTVSGGHPSFMSPLKSILGPGFDDGFFTTESQVANPLEVANPPSFPFSPAIAPARFSPSGLVPLVKVFDIGMLKSGSPKRAIWFYLNQVFDPILAPIGPCWVPLLNVAASACGYVAPWGMLEPVSYLCTGAQNPLLRLDRHFSYLQSDADHERGVRGTGNPTFHSGYRDTTFVGWGNEANDEESLAITGTGITASYSPSGWWIADTDPLVRAQDIPVVEEIVKGKRIGPFCIKIFRKKFCTRPIWIWRRTYHQLQSTKQKHQCDYVYETVLDNGFTSCTGLGTVFCDCSTRDVPCNNHGAFGHGCANSVYPQGALLTGVGTASWSNDTAVLMVTKATGSTCLFYQGTAQVNGGLGVPFGDGLRCVGGTIIRLGYQTIGFGGSAVYPATGDLPISVKGLIPSSGGTRHYQAWYRNATASFCPPEVFNLSNGYRVVWSP